MKEEPVKQAGIYNPTIQLDIFKDGKGKFNLDDTLGGWRWDGDTDDFALGLLRVGNSRIFKEFGEKMKQKGITKSDIKKAIKKSLDEDESDGLYAMLGDNRVYQNYGGFSDGECSNKEDDLYECLYDKVNSDKAKKIAEDIIGRADFPSERDTFERLEGEYAKDFLGRGRTWKKTVEDVVKGCSRTEKDVAKFFECISDDLSENKDDLLHAFDEEYGNDFLGGFSIKDKYKKQIADKHGVKKTSIDRCI